MKLQSDAQMNATVTLFRFLHSNIKLGLDDFDSADIGEILDMAEKNIKIKQNDDKQFL